MSADNLVKILFRFYSNIFDAETVETMWAEVVNAAHGYYKIDNIPFYVPNIATGDIVWAEYKDVEGMLTYRKTVECSGNSTLHVIIMNDEYEINSIRAIFENMGCESEKFNDKYFAMEVPAGIDYAPLKGKLDELRNNNVIDYAEACLSDNHGVNAGHRSLK
jgi:hypothetical protein